MAGGRYETKRPTGNGGAEKQITEPVRRGFRGGIGVRSALSEKFLRCARRAQQRNSVTAPPWKTVPAWAAGQVTKIGRVRTNDDGYYMAVLDGTTGATAPTHVNGASITDGGGVLWSFLRGTEGLTDDPLAPVLTISGTAPGSPLTNFVNPTVFPEKFRVLGAYAELYQSAWERPYSYQYNPDGSRGAYGSSISFITNAPLFAIRMNSNAKFRIVIDGRYYSMDCIIPDPDMGANDAWLTLNFGPKNRKRRRIEIEANAPASPFFGGIRMTELDYVVADDRETILGVWLGDSQWAGSGQHSILPGGSVPWVASKQLGWEDAWNCSRGSTGFLNPGGVGGTGTDYTYRQRLAEVLQRQPEVINVQLSTNDLGLYTSAAHANEVSAFLTQIRSVTDVPVLFWGFIPINNGNIPVFEAAVKAVIAARNDPQIKFNSLRDPADKFPFVSGNWNNTVNPPYSLPFSESHKLIIGNDGLHLSEIGALTYGEWIAMVTLGMINAGELG